MAQEPIWLSVARAFVGVTEIPGPYSNAVILNWAKDLNAPAYTNDDTAWCALFASRVLVACHLPPAGKGYDLLRARTFETYGQPLSEPASGAILVFTRSGGGHVGFYVGEHDTAFAVLGGNQGNKVSVTWIAKDRLSAIRWPSNMALPAEGRVRLKPDGSPLSLNEV